MEPLLTTMVLWLSINLGLPAIYDHPKVEFVTAAQMAAVRYRGLGADRPAHAAVEAGRTAPPELGQDVYAVYDDAKRIIYLRKEWTGTTPADASVLVHELVHHLQNAAGLKFDCPQEREKDAYKAQREWLALSGRTLKDEFEIDPMTVLVRTNCMN